MYCYILQKQVFFKSNLIKYLFLTLFNISLQIWFSFLRNISTTIYLTVSIYMASTLAILTARFLSYN